jgi:dolichol-phosphate mannosyltransferase
MKIGIVIPTYNERENIKKLIPKIFEIARKNKLNIEVLVVDDNSPDGTAEVVKKFQERFPITLIKRSTKLGLGSAYIAGFKKFLQNDVDVIFEMDADLSHDPKYIPNFLQKIHQNYDMVIGSRYIKNGAIQGWSIYRKILSRGGNFIGHFLAGFKINDVTSGFRAYKKGILEKVNLDLIKSSGYAFQLETLYRVLKYRGKVIEIPFVFTDRTRGKSKISKKDIVEFLNIALKIRLGLLNGR